MLQKISADSFKGSQSLCQKEYRCNGVRRVVSVDSNRMEAFTNINKVQRASELLAASVSKWLSVSVITSLDLHHIFCMKACSTNQFMWIVYVNRPFGQADFERRSIFPTYRCPFGEFIIFFWIAILTTLDLTRKSVTCNWKHLSNVCLTDKSLLEVSYKWLRFLCDTIDIFSH